MIPGFGAEASLYRTIDVYQSAYGKFADAASTGVVPQQSLCELGCVALQRVCHVGCAGISVYAPWLVPACLIRCAEHLTDCIERCNAPPPPAPPSGPPTPPICSVDVCPPVGPLRCCGGLQCRNGLCVPANGGFVP
jgi:hypothetical protein